MLRTRSWQVAPWLLAFVLLTGSGCGRQTPQEEAPPTRKDFVRRPIREPRMPPVQLQPAPEPVISRETTEADETGDGFTYQNDRLREGPFSINLVKIDRSRVDLELTTTIGRGGSIGLSPLSDQVESIPADVGQPVAAINGDFYRTEHENYAGDPRGLQISGGEVVSAPSPAGKSAFWIDANGQPHAGNVASQFKIIWPDGDTTPFGLNEERHSNDAILYTHRAGSSTRASGGRELVLVRSGDSPWLPLRVGETYTAEVKDVRQSGNTRLSPDILVLSIGRTLLARVPEVEPGAILKISTATTPDLAGVPTAIGGSPVLVRNGKVQSVYSNRADERHPRTAIGWNGHFFYFAQVDGRQHGFSVGMSLRELASYLVKQGCEEAVNLDGGGSSEMWFQGRVVNRPCFGYERSTANALVLVRHPKLAVRQ